MAAGYDRTSERAILEPARETRIYDKVDVLVVGGGPAGVGAALAAARSGMKTLCVERYGCLGGIWTAGLLNPYFDATNKGGIPCEIVDRLRDSRGTDAVQNWDKYAQWGTAVFNYESMKFVLDSMALEAGVKLLFYTNAVATITEADSVRGVIVENKSGRSAILADVVIDCTGDADVAYHAGCQYELGRMTDGLLQPMTLQFKLGGFSFNGTDEAGAVSLYETLIKFNPPEALAEIPFKGPAAVPVPGEPDTVAVMWTHIHGVDGTNADDLTRAVIEGRRQVQKCVELFHSAREVVGDVRLLETAMQVGVRESRRIRGEYRLELEDLVNGRTFEDGVCRVTFNVDIHLPDGTELKATPVQPYEIPYRCLVPIGVENLLVAGRCISGSHEAHGSYRVTGNCVAMGQAAGVAAAEAIRQRTTVRHVDGRGVRRLLKQQGANL